MGEGAPVRWVIKNAKYRFAVQLAAPVRVLTGPFFRSRTRTALSSRDSGFPRANAVEMRVDFSERTRDAMAIFPDSRTHISKTEVASRVSYLNDPRFRTRASLRLGQRPR